ncbi:MAG TPA: hypothetical protein VMU04_25215 [Candidatus Acidoferrum sp.]|nr:hypothetical protein [Candidatus Acidoferrum sp.]
MSDNARTRNLLVGLAGAIAGGVVGYLVFMWLGHQGFVAPLLPGGMVGLGGGMLVRDRSPLRAAVCGVLALGLSIFSEWSLLPFIRDGSFGYFVTHLHLLSPLTLLMLVAGGGLGFWLSLGRDPGAKAGAGPSLTP